MWLTVLVSVFAAGASPAQSAVDLCRVSGPPATYDLCKALATSSGAERSEAVAVALDNGLLSPDTGTRRAVFEFLLKRSAQFNPLPYRETIEKFAALEDSVRASQARAFLDETELKRAPRSERLHAHREAMVSGSVKLTRGTTWPRRSATHAAALEGLAELEPLIEKYAREDTEASAMGVTPEMLGETVRMRAGAADEADAELRAAKVVGGLTPVQFGSKMEKGSGFRQAVLELCQMTCDREPGGEPCKSLRAVWRQQTAVKEETAKARRPEAGRAETTTPREKGDRPWIDVMGTSVRRQ